jgi:hypothetical protein
MEDIVHTFGAPDEVATAYRDSDARVTAALPVFIGFIGITRIISLAEGRLLEAVSGERMPRRPVHPGAPEGLVARSIAMVTDVQTWTTIVYLLLMLPLGIIYFVTAVTGVAVGVSLLLVPVFGVAERLGRWRPWENTGDIVFSPAWLDTPAGWIFCVASGLVVLTTLLHVARGVVGVHARTAKTLLVSAT